MKASLFGIAAAVLIASGVSSAQVSRTIQGEEKTLSGTVEAIDRAARDITIKKDNGTYQVINVPASVSRFDALKIGDKLKARYYENVVFSLQPPGQKPKDSASAALSPAPGERPGGTLAAQRTITATISAIDLKVPSIGFKGPNGWAYESRVRDRSILEKVKVGDQVDITWTSALLLSFE
jgi:Cu/Ag efflux protein CusF